MLPVEICHRLGCQSWGPHPYFLSRTTELINVTKEHWSRSWEPRGVGGPGLAALGTCCYSLSYSFENLVLLWSSSVPSSQFGGLMHDKVFPSVTTMPPSYWNHRVLGRERNLFTSLVKHGLKGAGHGQFVCEWGPRSTVSGGSSGVTSSSCSVSTSAEPILQWTCEMLPRPEDLWKLVFFNKPPKLSCCQCRWCRKS